jgi:hypothetical protein
MVIRNLNLALQNLNAALVANQGRVAVAGIKNGLWMHPVLSYGRSKSPRFTVLEPVVSVVDPTTPRTKPGLGTVGLPGNSVLGSCETSAWVAWESTGIAASEYSAKGRPSSMQRLQHRQQQDHDYLSHDRCSDVRNVYGLASSTNHGK